MKKHILSPLILSGRYPSRMTVAIGAIAIVLAACGDTVENVNQMGMDVVASEDDLPKCSGSNEGEQAFVMDAGTTLICVDGKWVPSVSGEGAEFSCKTVELKDKSGLKIVCNGDSIGVVLNGENGKNGKDGKDGDDGASGSGCSITDRNDTAVVVVCGDSTMTISLGVGQSGDSLEGDLDRVPISLDSLAGYTQKGPFLKGSTVYLYELSDGRTLKQTNGNFTSNISSDDGRYKFSARDLVSQYAMVVVDGYYRNEVTGATSDATIRLKAITDMRKRSSVNVNLLTHMEYDRVYNLVTKEKKSVKQAKQQAQEELLKIFHIELDGKTDAEDMDVFGKTDADAALLAISVVLQGDRSEADLASLLAAFAADLSDNGLWDNIRDRAQIADWAMKKTLSKEGLASIRKNVEGWGLGDGKAPAFEGMVENFWETELKIGECSSENPGAIKAVNNKYSTYFAQKDSVASEGDSSDVRLVCEADGDVYAWRYATDIEKNTAAITGATEGLAKRGAINTQNVYVYEGGWRRGTDLDSTLNLSCIADRAGKMANLGATWYTCDTVPTAWREATADEADTAGFGAPTGDDPIVRVGNVDKSHIYVFEDAEGDGNGKWRYGTALDLDGDLGPCTSDKVNNVARSSKNAWFKCIKDGPTHVEGSPVPTEWREATNYEKDTYGKEGTLGDYIQGNANNNLYYVKEEYGWRPATDLEMSGLEACTQKQKNTVDSIGTGWYKCTNEISTRIDTFTVAYTWRKAQDIEVDTNGLGSSHAVGDTAWGRLHNNVLYVYEKGNWVISYNKTMDALVGMGCVDGLNSAVAYGSNGVKYTCYIRSESEKNWVDPYGIMVDTIGWAQLAPAGGWKNGTVRNGRANTEITYVYQDTCWRYGTALDSIFAKQYASQGGSACMNDGDTTSFTYEGNYYLCMDQAVGDTIRMWTPAPDVYIDTKDYREKCKEFDTNYGHGELVQGKVNTDKYYVCDKDHFRDATSEEVSLGKGCVSYIYNHIYKLNGSFKKCIRNGWTAAASGDQAAFRDTDGRTYKTVLIGTQHWMAENLKRYWKYNNGLVITDGVYYYPWSDAENACPAGWRLPSPSEWRTLLNYAGADALKSTTGWSNDGNGTDKYGFSVYPDGYYSIGSELQKGYDVHLWTSDLVTYAGEAHYYGMSFVYRSSDCRIFDQRIEADYFKYIKMPIRCIQDN